MTDPIIENLKKAIQIYSLSVIDEPKRCENIIRDVCGSKKREMNLLINALEEQIPQTLLEMQGNSFDRKRICTERLMEFRGYAPELANWAVITWEFLLDLLKPSDAFRINFQPGIYIDFVEVPAGVFRMGNPKPEFDGLILSNETPEHDLYLETYLISKTPITIKQFSYFVQETGYITIAEEVGKGWICVGDRFQQEQSGVCWKMPNGVAINTNHRAEHPVTVVSWTDAVAFCDWASNKSGLLVSLPSEAEWEKAARGMDGRIYPWGSQQPDGQLSNFGFSVGDTTAVGSYHPYGDSPYSCYDMAGNVWEWTRSQPGKYPYQPNDGREEIKDQSARRQIRGGSFGYDYRYLRTCARHSCGPAYCRNDLGFRVVTYHDKNNHKEQKDVRK